MTIPRVLMAACILILGFMLWGIHTGLSGLTKEAQGLRADMVAEIRGIPKPVPPPAQIVTPPERIYVPLPQPRPTACICQRHKARAHRNRTPPVSVVTPSQLNEIDRMVASRRVAISKRQPPPRY